MASRSWPTVARALLVELASWSVLVAVFLWTYLRQHAGDWRTVAAHADLLLATWLGLIALRLAMRRLLPSHAARWISALLCALLLLALLAYYGVVVVGLNAWGRVISWVLIKTYAGQLTDLGEMVAVPWPVTVGAPLLLLAAMAWLLAQWPMRRDGPLLLNEHLSGGWALLVVAALLGFAGLRLYEFREYPPVRHGEPVSMTFYPGQAQTGLISRQSAWRGQLDAQAQAAYRPNEKASKRNVILIVGDALRHDHMNAYGYGRPTTPFINESIRAGNAVISRSLSAVCSESVCGLMGLARSKYVHELTSESMSLTQVLKRHGYAIHMILGGDHANYYELKHAYGPVDSYFDGSMAKGYYMNDDQLVVERVRTLPQWNGEPQMFQFHLMSSHGLGKRQEEFWIWRPARYSYSGRTLSGNTVVPELVNYYDNGIRQFDHVVQVILGELRAKGYLQNALVVVTADHGEMLGEHNLIGHAKPVHESALRIPLVMFRYGYESSSDIVGAGAGAGSQVDVAPTILHELDMPAPSSWSGQPLQRKPFDRTFADFQQGLRVGLLDYRHPPRILKYWRDLEQESEHAYDIAADPQEKTDLIATLPATLQSQWRQLLLPGISAAQPSMSCCSAGR
jgi:glucan phosphoethanolaminetransferase (alkaline phosphatase superfamily)